MREIKFRGHNGYEWIYSECIYFNEFPTLNDRLIHMPNEKDNNCDILDIETWDTVFGLGQFTGLKDANGVEIYEGDIVKNEIFGIGKVIFLQQEMGYVVVYKNSDHRLGHRNTGSLYEIDLNLEIVGNIYEDKELLEPIND